MTQSYRGMGGKPQMYKARVMQTSHTWDRTNLLADKKVNPPTNIELP